MKTLLLTITVCVALLPASTAISQGYEPGDIVQDFKLRNIDDKMVSLSDYKGSKGVIVIFDCNTCPYSKAYNDRIIALNAKYAMRGFPVVTINSNDADVSPGDSFKEMKSKAKKKNYTFPYLLDNSQQVAHAFGATNTPHTFVLKRQDEKFILEYKGAIDNNSRDGSRADRKYVEEAVDALLAGDAVTVRKTKAVGCGIWWKEG